MNIFHKRQGQMLSEYIYFYTQSVFDMKPLLQQEKCKVEIIASLRYLKNQNLIKLYGFVIMPDHMHFLWSIYSPEGMESPAAKLSKYTSHRFKKILDGTDLLEEFRSDKKDRKYQFWKRDPLAVQISSDEAFYQKLEYIHDNPVKAELSEFSEDYHWSSASFYMSGVDEFGVLTHFKE